MKTMLHLFFDLTANDGWNGVAMGTYSILAVLVVTVILERKKP